MIVGWSNAELTVRHRSCTHVSQWDRRRWRAGLPLGAAGATALVPDSCGPLRAVGDACGVAFELRGVTQGGDGTRH